MPPCFPFIFRRKYPKPTASSTEFAPRSSGIAPVELHLAAGDVWNGLQSSPLHCWPSRAATNCGTPFADAPPGDGLLMHSWKGAEPIGCPFAYNGKAPG